VQLQPEEVPHLLHEGISPEAKKGREMRRNEAIEVRDTGSVWTVDGVEFPTFRDKPMKSPEGRAVQRRIREEAKKCWGL
jgi:hypothetical protein